MAKEISTHEQNLLIENFLNSVIFQGIPENISDVLSLVDSPFINRHDCDAISLLFHRFYKNTDIPLALPIFGFFSMISAWLVFNSTSMKIPFTKEKTELNTWVMALAESGANKTMSFKHLLKIVPKDPATGLPIITPNISKPDGPKAMIMQLAALENGKGWWFQDEAAQMFKGIEQPGSPMSEMKDILLKIKDGDKVERLNSKEHIVVEGTVMTQFFINTIDSMAKTLSDDSMKDGLFRRYQIAIAEKDSDRKFTDFPLYRLDELIDDHLTKELDNLFSQDVEGKQFMFHKDCISMYEVCFTAFWERQYSKFMTSAENIFRTYMMESWKYAVFHHVIHQKIGTEISAESMQYGLKVSMFLLNSLQSFIKYRAETEKSLPIQSNRIQKFIDFILANENKKGFGIRPLQRKFNMKKDEVKNMLTSIKAHNPKFKTKLFDLLEKEDE